ncbi:MAG: hypothetical protein J6112_07145 [Clostridia bacterium]|nr:hypothetical protein [Clostridia bacterium]
MFILHGKLKPEKDDFIPAPYADPYAAGFAIEAPEAPAGTPWDDPAVAAGEGVLSFKLGAVEIRLTDSIHSGWLHAASGGNLNAMFNVIEGDFDFFKKDSVIKTLKNDGRMTVVRVSTLLKERESGAELGGAYVHTDLYFWKALKTVTVMTVFETKGYTPVREIYQCRAEADGEAYMNPDGGWRKLSDTPQTGSGGLLVCRDLSEYGAAHPIVTHVSVEKGELPLVRFEPRNWQGSVIESGDLTIKLEKTANGLGIGSINDKKGIVKYDGTAPEPLFKLLVRSLDTGREEMLSSLSDWDNVILETTSEGPVFRFEKGPVNVTLAAVLEPELSRIGWEISARIRDKNITALRLDPPAARMNANYGVNLFMSYGPGMDVPIGDRSEIHSMSPYPSIGMCMQYMAIYDVSRRRGIYNGYHDPEGSYKFLLGDTHLGVCKTEAMIPAEGIDEPANGFFMKGQDVWQLFDGDWYDATVIFRDWVWEYACWFTGEPAAERKDVPEWLLKMPVWMRADFDEKRDWIGELLKAREDFREMPMGLHLYCWHKIPFDTNYPHYNPEKDTFHEALEVLRSNNIKVMPYINGRLWDTHDKGDEDYQFTSVAKPGAAKGRNGEVITEHYGSKNSKGEDIELAVMCPSSAIWQEKQLEINNWILNDLDADAVYIDQIAAAPPVTCMDKTHPHRLGGGSWWYYHYYNLIGHLRLHAGKDKCFTTESNAEPFAGHIGGMLVWHWVGPHQVPAFPVVYGEYQPTFGRNYGICKEDDTGISFRILTAESLCFGDQPGWVTPDIYLESPYRDLFKQVAKLRFKYNDFYYAGTCQRPPKLEGDLGRLTGAGFDSLGVRSGMWRRKSDGKRIVTLVNVTEESRSFRVIPEDAEPFETSMDPISAKLIEL